MRTARLILVVALAVAMLASGGGSLLAAPAAQSGIEMTASAGYGSDGSYLIGEWFPVRVALTNPAGASARRVHVIVDSERQDSVAPFTTYSREVDLPAQSRKEVTLYAYSTTFDRTLNVRVLEGSTVIKAVDIALTPYEQLTNLLIGVISSDPSLLNALNGEGLGHTEYTPQESLYSQSMLPASTSARAAVLHMGIADIPPLSNALDGLDVIVFDDVDTGTLTASQKESLSAWVARDGMLVGLGRPGGGSALSALADLLPVTPGNPVTLTGLASLGDLVATPITPTGQILAPSATLRDVPDLSARALAMQDDVPLVAMRDLGRGHVAYVGLSPAIAPLKGWDGTVPLFKRIIAEHPVRFSANASRRVDYAPSLFISYGDLFDIPGLDLPSEGVLGLFLLVYIIIIGPINFIVLRRMKRGELAWLTIPAVVLLFSLGAYVVGYGAKGGDLLAVRSNVIHTALGMPRASVAHFFGIFSPQRGTYNMEVVADSSISEISPSGYSSSARPENPALVTGGGDTGPTRLTNVNVNTWSLRAFLAESALPAEPPLEVNLHLGDDTIEGTVRNRSSEELQDVALIRGDTTQLVGTLAPGQEAQVRLAISQQAMVPGSPERLLLTPPGVNPSGSSFYYNYDQQPSSDVQRRYNRQVQLLSTGLSDLLSNSAPADMSVIALAWGPPAPGGFTIAGSTPRFEELNLWTARVPVRADGDTQPKIRAGAVPFSIYAPGHEPKWLDSAEGAKSSLSLSPYVDFLVRLPVATRAGGLHLEYGTAVGDNIAVLAYNVRTGTWDRLGNLSTTVGVSTSLGIPTAESYIGPGGNVTFRLLPESSGLTLGLSPLAFSLK